MTYDQHAAAYDEQSVGGADYIWLTGLLLTTMFVVYVAQRFVPGVTETFIYSPYLGEYDRYRWITAGFLHSPSSVVHLFVNFMALWSCGAALERVLGRWRFLTVFLVSVIGGHFAVSLLNDSMQMVLGASGGIFGLFGALLVTQLRERTPIRPVVMTIGINTACGVLIPGISWEAHLGGLVAGTLAAAVLGLPRVKRRYDQRWARQLGGTR